MKRQFRSGLAGAAAAALLSAAPLLAYVSHTNEAAIREARAAGADKVIARGAFAQQLPELLKTY